MILDFYLTFIFPLYSVYHHSGSAGNMISERGVSESVSTWAQSYRALCTVTDEVKRERLLLRKHLPAGAVPVQTRPLEQSNNSPLLN